VSHQGDFAPRSGVGRRVGEAGLGFLGLHSFDAGQRHTLAGALFRLLKLKISVCAADQKQPAAQQDRARGGSGGRRDGRWQEVQAQELGEKVGVRNVVGVFSFRCRLHPGRIGRARRDSRDPETVPPTNNCRWTRRHGGDALLVRFEQLQDGSQVAGELLVDRRAAFVHQAARALLLCRSISDHNLHSVSVG